MNDQKYQLFPACDVDMPGLKRLVKETHQLPGIGGYKIGFRLALEFGLKPVVEAIRTHTNKPVIYDHQKAATDIPDTSSLFAKVCQQAGINSVILFPLTGPEVLKSWVKACQDAGLQVQVGGYMTHPGYLENESGFIRAQAAEEIYFQAADLGVNQFVVPGTRPDFSWSIFEALQKRGVEPTFYSPGIGKQGGEWKSLQRDSGPSWHAYVGRSLYQAENIRKAAENFLKQSVG